MGACFLPESLDFSLTYRQRPEFLGVMDRCLAAAGRSRE